MTHMILTLREINQKNGFMVSEKENKNMYLSAKQDTCMLQFETHSLKCESFNKNLAWKKKRTCVVGERERSSRRQRDETRRECNLGIPEQGCILGSICLIAFYDLQKDLKKN